jgi:hypothetical protein
VLQSTRIILPPLTDILAPLLPPVLTRVSFHLFRYVDSTWTYTCPRFLRCLVFSHQQSSFALDHHLRRPSALKDDAYRDHATAALVHMLRGLASLLSFEVYTDQHALMGACGTSASTRRTPNATRRANCGPFSSTSTTPRTRCEHFLDNGRTEVAHLRAGVRPA